MKKQVNVTQCVWTYKHQTVPADIKSLNMCFLQQNILSPPSQVYNGPLDKMGFDR